MNKTKTGIKGFDDLLNGGIPTGSIVLVSGTPGTGKTIFGLEYLYRGALNDEKGLFITFEEPKSNIAEQAMQFGWDLEKLEKKNILHIQHISSKTITNATLKEIVNFVKKEKIKRLVIDSISTLALSIPTIHNKVTEITDFAIKRFLHQFLEDLRDFADTTTLLIGQTTSEKHLSTDEVSEFIADGIIHILYESLGRDYSRSLIIRKMRKVKNDEDIHPLEISKTGLTVHTLK
ncbi:AAA family ATPase [Candidatus Woesearchaeota archaeon]|nr:AAA family ATPase [Candidatus Woesearchaeota archaeon]